MKYLVNRETKEHKIYEGGPYPEVCDIVDADDEGWIKWVGGECPLPPGSECEFLCENGRQVKTGVDVLEWRKGIEGFSDVTFYRPILPAESKPEHQRVLDEFKSPFGPCPPDAEPADNVFKRFNAAVAASESIPALIAEINAMLPDRFEIVEKAKIEKIAEDMSDWRNWKKGDLLQCVNSEGWGEFENGKIYTVTREAMGGVYISFVYISSSFIEDFKFHSRPVTK